MFGDIQFFMELAVNIPVLTGLQYNLETRSLRTCFLWVAMSGLCNLSSIASRHPVLCSALTLCRATKRSDGARGKKQVWRPHVRTWGLSEANTLYWRRYMWHYWDFSAPFAVIRRLLVIRRLHSASVPGEKGPFAPTRYAPDIVHQISQKTMANKTDFSDAKPPVSKTICNFCNADSCPEEGIKSLNIFLTSGWY